VWHEKARSVAFHRVEGRVCDPRSRACVRQLDRSGGHTTHRRTGTDRGYGRVLESSVWDWIHLAVPRVESPLLRSRAGALA
jgi:hypothetical protein